MASTKFNGSDEEICSLLDRIREKTGKDDALVFRYRFHGLFHEEGICDKSEFTIKDGYVKLRQHERYYRNALSLVLHMLEDINSKEEFKELTDHLDSTRANGSSHESNIRNQCLNLWALLTDIATRLNKIDGGVRDLVDAVGYDLQVNTDHIKAIQGDEYSLDAALKAFRQLEMKEKLEPMESREILNSLLRQLKKVNLLNIVKSFDPNTSVITIVLDNIEKMKDKRDQPTLTAYAEFKKNLIDVYRNTSIIESTQWPPVKSHFYINLALITPEFIPRSDSYSRATIRGSVDDVYKKKEPIDFKYVFPDKLTSQKHFVSLIQGRPGCGKSTLMIKVSRDWADGEILKDTELFVLVYLRQFVGREDLTLKDLFGAYCSNPATLDAVLDRVTKEGGKGVCFAFDGLDEYSSKLKHDNIIMKLIHGQELPLAAVYMTSRPATSQRFRNKTILTQSIEIIGFLEEEIEKYVHSYYKDEDGGKTKAVKLMNYIKDHPNIQRMCYLPLHIAMVVHLYDLDHDKGSLLPKTETELYHKFTLITLYRSSEKEMGEDCDQEDISLEEFSDLSIKWDAIFRQVCKLAFSATVEQKQMFTGREIKKIVGLPEIPKRRDFDSVGLLTVDRTIVQKSGNPATTFSFFHLTHQEFLAAVHIVDHMSESEQLTTIKDLAAKVHMWMVWKFFCGMHSRNSGESLSTNEVFKKAFQLIITDNTSSHLACLNMVHCAFESQNQASCSDLLAHDHIKGVINVVDIALNPSDCSALGYVLAKAHEEIKEIDFSYCHLGPDGIAAFVKQLESSDRDLAQVEVLRLRARTDYKPVGIEGASNLRRLLRKLPQLGELRLYGNKLKTQTFQQYLAPAIADLKQIHTLILSRNDLEVGTGSQLSEVLGNLPLLHTFYASYNPLKDEGLGDMKPGLLKCKELKIFGVRGTHLSEGAGAHMSDILTTLPKLEWIELYQNNLGDKGVIDMVPGLLKSQSLLKLSLVENNVSDEGARALVPYLSSTNTLREMRIYYNHQMTDKGKIALRTAVVERESHLCELGLAV